MKYWYYWYYFSTRPTCPIKRFLLRIDFNAWAYTNAFFTFIGTHFNDINYMRRYERSGYKSIGNKLLLFQPGISDLVKLKSMATIDRKAGLDGVINRVNLLRHREYNGDEQ